MSDRRYAGASGRRCRMEEFLGVRCSKCVKADEAYVKGFSRANKEQAYREQDYYCEGYSEGNRDFRELMAAMKEMRRDQRKIFEIAFWEGYSFAQAEMETAEQQERRWKRRMQEEYAASDYARSRQNRYKQQESSRRGGRGINGAYSSGRDGYADSYSPSGQRQGYDYGDPRYDGYASGQSDYSRYAYTESTYRESRQKDPSQSSRYGGDSYAQSRRKDQYQSSRYAGDTYTESSRNDLGQSSRHARDTYTDSRRKDAGQSSRYTGNTYADSRYGAETDGPDTTYTESRRKDPGQSSRYTRNAYADSRYGADTDGPGTTYATGLEPEDDEYGDYGWDRYEGTEIPRYGKTGRRGYQSRRNPFEYTRSTFAGNAGGYQDAGQSARNSPTSTQDPLAEKDWYGIMGVDNKASQEEIESKFKELRKKYHPDKHVNSTEGKDYWTQKFQDLGAAYEMLKNPSSRNFYDARLRRKRNMGGL